MLHKVTTLLVTACVLVWSHAAHATEQKLDSPRFPLHIFYPENVSENTARQALGFAENTWEKQVVEMGFAAPSTVDDQGNVVPGLNIHLDPNGSYSHAQPVANMPATSWSDCAVEVHVGRVSPVDFLELTLAHEMNHAVQMAQDCGEAPFAFENTTVAITYLMFPMDTMLPRYFLPAFQSNPYNGLDCTFFADASKQYYHFGSALFAIFLEEKYGNSDGTLLGEVWQAAKQDGSVSPDGTLDGENKPDILQAMDTVLREHGTTLHEAFAEFARWRFFVGTEDDGHHFRHGNQWGGAELALTTSHRPGDMPIVNAYLENNLPQEFGSSYIELALDDVPEGRMLVLDFRGDTAVTWSVDAMLIRADKTADIRPVTLQADATGQLRAPDLQGFNRLVLAVTNLGRPGHDANMPECNNGDIFRYGLSLEDPVTAPTIRRVEPSVLTAGTTTQVWVTGEKFMNGILALVSGDGISVRSVHRVDEQSVGLEIDVSATAQTGVRDLTLINPPAHLVSLPQAFSVVATTSSSSTSSSGDNGSTDDKDEGGRGCVCTVPGSNVTMMLLVMCMALVTFRARRR